MAARATSPSARAGQSVVSGAVTIWLTHRGVIETQEQDQRIRALEDLNKPSTSAAVNSAVGRNGRQQQGRHSGCF